MGRRRGQQRQALPWLIKNLSKGRSTFLQLASAATLGGISVWIVLESTSSTIDDRKQKQISNEHHHPALKYGTPSFENIKVQEGYVAAYDRRMRNPKWVCEYLTKAALFPKTKSSATTSPSVDRSGMQFKADNTTPRAFRVSPKDFINSGYDRGHLAPARDMNTSEEHMAQSFLMTNVSPQVGRGFNRDYWARFEGFIRHLTTQYDELYVITGPLYLPKKVKDKFIVKYEVIGRTGGIPTVAVPTHFFKAILAVRGDQLLTEGFILPNKAISANTALEVYKTPLKVIESYAGLELFAEIADKEEVKPLCNDTTCKLKKMVFRN